jgi:endonuclease VIII
MPEGHTVHRLAIRHRELFAGRPVEASSPQGRFAHGASRISRATFRDAEAVGKHLLHHYDNHLAVHVHLGLYGKFTDGTSPVPAPVGEVRLRLVGRRHWLDLRGPAACELLTVGEVEMLRTRLGADPLRDDADSEVAYRRLIRSGRPVATVLMDQSVVAGPGLVYVSEVLFRAGIAPTRPARQVSAVEWGALWLDLRALMKEGVAIGRIDTVHSQHTPEAMRRPPRVDRHGGEVYVYRRAGRPCLVCGTEIARSTLAGRNSYWCPHCQPA